jgi:hypothetical protein
MLSAVDAPSGISPRKELAPAVLSNLTGSEASRRGPHHLLVVQGDERHRGGRAAVHEHAVGAGAGAGERAARREGAATDDGGRSGELRGAWRDGAVLLRTYQIHQP